MNPDAPKPPLPDHLDLELPEGKIISTPHQPLTPEALAAWRHHSYQLALKKDPQLRYRWTPKTIPFELD